MSASARGDGGETTERQRGVTAGADAVESLELHVSVGGVPGGCHAEGTVRAVGSVGSERGGADERLADGMGGATGDCVTSTINRGVSPW